MWVGSLVGLLVGVDWVVSVCVFWGQVFGSGCGQATVEFKHQSRQVSRVRLADSACGVESVQGASGEEGVEEDGGRQGEVMEGETPKECK